MSKEIKKRMTINEVKKSVDEISEKLEDTEIVQKLVDELSDRLNDAELEIIDFVHLSESVAEALEMMAKNTAEIIDLRGRLEFFIDLAISKKEVDEHKKTCEARAASDTSRYT